MEKSLIESAIKYATSNKEALSNSTNAGCYYCLRIYPASEVAEFLEVEDTAICPYCDIDSVLPDNTPIELNKANLEELQEYWF